MRYSNCITNSIKKCEPINLPVLNYSRIDNKISQLKKLEKKAEKVEKAAAAALNAAYFKLNYLQK